MINKLHVGRFPLKQWLTSSDNNGFCYQRRVSESHPRIPRFIAVFFFVLITDTVKTKGGADTHPEVYKLDAKVSSTCFLTLTQSFSWPAHSSLYLFFTSQHEVYLICLRRSAVSVRQSSGKQASQATSDRLSYRWQAELGLLTPPTPGPIFRSIVQNFSDPS